MPKSSLFLLVAALMACGATGVRAENWKVGEKWTYHYEGPRPYGDGTVAVDGDAVLEVTAIESKGAAKRYLLKSQYGRNDPTPSISHIDPNNRLYKIEVGTMMAITFRPPIFTIWPLKVGAEKTLQTQMDLGGFSVAVEYAAKRMKDETLSVPAGEFNNCQHVQILSTIKSEMIPNGRSKVDYWYHPGVRNLVKEVIVTNYQGDNSYTSTSTLKTHVKGN